MTSPSTVLLPHTPDHATYSNYVSVETTHLHLDWTINWEKQLVGGSVKHEMKVVGEEEGGLKEVVLDTRDLEVKRVEVDGKDAKFTISAAHETLGSALHIALPTSYAKGNTFEVLINYSTTADCSALGWLEASQTKGGLHPYLYSQSQAIHARSLIPSQDTPSIKSTYSASVHSTLPVLLSAIRISPSISAPLETGGKTVEYKYEQKVKVPSYLIAIAAGNLVYKEISKQGENGASWRTGVWSEPEQIEASYWEFKEDQAKFVAAAEKLTGRSYDWGVYDVLVLPPAFPYGGMENTCLTFATPTLLAGDRSLVDVVGHEISHSWFGNLIGCSSWAHFWLNEGFTTYLERLLMQALHSPAERGLSYIIGAKALSDSLEGFEKKGNKRFQRLVIPYHEGEDPDDAFSTVPYDKGSNFLLHLEITMGGLDVFLPYVQSYVKTFAGLSISTDDWKAHLYAYFTKNGGPEAVKKLDGVQWDAWLNGEGTKLPVDMSQFYDASLADAAYDLAARWAAAGSDEKKLAAFSKEDIASFGTSQKVVFLEKLETSSISPLAVAKLDEIYSFTQAGNAETALRFYEIALASGDAYAQQAAVWVQDKGRMKFCRPIFVAINKVAPELAKSTFKEHAGFYHPIARRMIAKDLGVKL
ncbi:peptidase family M1-domain-containing protein [Mrakia frigida]|uniref:bifunctional aminopeptidase/epoxide hydrolase n=1 Tax=Mrakia frigida TaxID=29902 RepID=UPI003FCBF510